MHKISLNKEDVTKELSAFLEKKYQSTFTVQEAYQEFDGDSGDYIRALCRSSDYEDTFIAYCYKSDEERDNLISINGQAYFVDDKYAEVIIQNHLLKQLGDYNENSLFVRCKVNFISEQPTVNLIENPKSCIAETKAYIRIYIITGEEDPSSIQARAESILQEYNPYTGYVYVATKKPFNLTDINAVYETNQHDFGNYLTNENLADHVVFTLYNSQKGLQDRKVVKE